MVNFKGFFNDIRQAVLNLFKQNELSISDVQVSDKMAEAITSWFRLFYDENSKLNGEHHTRFVNVLTNYMATLATNEILITAGTGARAEYINDQLSRFFMPGICPNEQLAAVGGQVILKPFVSGKNIYSEIITADRYYPTRINAAGIVEAGFFTDFDKKNGRTVVRIERFDLQADGLYINNKAYYVSKDGIHGEFPLNEIYRWKNIAPDVLIRGIDRVHFAVLKMPFANCVDNTSKLPVSLFSKSLDSIREFDNVYSEFIREIHTGKRRLIFDRSVLKRFEGKPPLDYSELATDFYIILNGDPDTAKPYNDYTPNLRIEEYQKALNILLRLIEMQSGFSAGTFTFDVRTGKLTATQVISEDKDTYNTIKSIQECGMAQGLKDLIYLYDIYATLYHLAPTGKIEPSVSFGDSIFEDTAVEFQRRKLLADGGYLKGEKLVSWYFGISEEEALNDYMPAERTPDDILFGR